MPRYLISFDDGAMDFIPEEEMPAVGNAAHAVIKDAQDAGVWVFAGGVYPHDEVSVSVVATDGTVTDGPDSKAYIADSRSSACPHVRRRCSGQPRSPSPAAVLKRSASSGPTRPWATDRARRPSRLSDTDRFTRSPGPAFGNVP